MQHCIYGVDLNPMAIELATISLWLKASFPSKPLTFLDNHLKIGNSLIGFAKKIIIPSAAQIEDGNYKRSDSIKVRFRRLYEKAGLKRPYGRGYYSLRHTHADCTAHC